MPPDNDRREPSDQERFESFATAITDTYAAGPVHPRPQRDAPRKRTFIWFALPACAIGAMCFAAALQRLPQREAATPPAITAVEPVVTPRSILARTTSAPRTPPPRATPAPTVKPSPAAATALSLNDAPALVRSNTKLAVGKKGSCGGDDVSVDVPGFTRGCTLFGLASSGELKNGKGAVLIVPVSTTEDIANVAYGLLYVRSGSAAPPRFVGLLSSDESGPLVMRVRKGLIVQQNGTNKRYFTFDGRRIVRVSDAKD